MKKVNIPIEAKVDLLSPAFNQHIDAIVLKKQEELETRLHHPEHWFVQGRRECYDLLKRHVLVEYWEIFNLFFLGNAPLYCFIEMPLVGLVNKNPKFWYFFAPKSASEYFNAQQLKPKDFGKKTIFKFPQPQFQKMLVETAVTTLKDEEMDLPEKLQKTMEAVQLIDEFKTDLNVSGLEEKVKVLITEETRSEAGKLKKDIHDAGRSPMSLEKRLTAVFNICWRYFNKRDPLENKYYKKILSSSNEERTKGLNLVLKKTGDFLEENRATVG